MKAPARPLRSPRSPRRLPSLESVFPGIGKMSDIESFRQIFSIWQRSYVLGLADASFARGLLDSLLQNRGLEFLPNGEFYDGCEVYALTRDGECLATFSSELPIPRA